MLRTLRTRRQFSLPLRHVTGLARRDVSIERVVSEFVLNHPEPELERAALDQQETGQDEMLVEANSNEGKAS